jgi:lipopolysaccharide biosynthesis regulator YciM
MKIPSDTDEMVFKEAACDRALEKKWGKEWQKAFENSRRLHKTVNKRARLLLAHC